MEDLKKHPDYKKGYRRGFDDEILQWYQLRNYSKEFQAGYRDGQDEIQRLIDEHVATR